MNYPSKEIIKRIRNMYPTGCRVELVRRDDLQAPPIGTHGTVIGVDDTGSILVDWDNGSGLNGVYGEDLARRICPICGGPMSEHPALSRRDNRTEICSDCGTREALADLGMDEEDQDAVIAEIQRLSDQK